VISADFPGEASRYVEELFENRTVAIFSQGASGDQNPKDFRTSAGFNRQRTTAEAYGKVLARTGDYVHMLGLFIGSSAVRVMRESMQPTDAARIWAAQETVACPGRIRLDADNPARENVFPGYKDGPDVNLKVGVLRVGDIHFATVNGEVYSEIATRLKAEAPANKTIVVTLANGFANSGYIYSDAAYSHLTFQVIGSRLKPGCAEGKIVSTALDLMRRSAQ
jgi:neutral ceramidase